MIRLTAIVTLDEKEEQKKGVFTLIADFYGCTKEEVEEETKDIIEGFSENDFITNHFNIEEIKQKGEAYAKVNG